MATVFGSVSSSGAVSSGSKFTSSTTGTGTYVVTFAAGAFDTTPTVVVTPTTKSGYVCAASIYNRSYSGFTVNISNMSGSFQNYGFCFIAEA